MSDRNQNRASILVVDDDAYNRKYYVQVLNRENYAVDEAMSGERAIEKIESKNYDLILSDLQMYKVGGLDVLQIAKEKNKHTQVVIMTGFGNIPIAVKAMQQGAFDFLSKPVNKDVLLMRIEKALQQQKLHIQIEEQQQKINEYNQMIQNDLELAEKVQNSLVPSNFENDKVRVGIEYHPMIGIGGDFCSIYEDNNDRLYLNLIDVTGHGIAAALTVNRVSNEMRRILRQSPQPKEILSQMNTFFYNTFGNMGIFLTIMSVCLEFENKELTFAGSAHPAALHYNFTKKELNSLDSQNVIVGFQPSQKNTFIQDTRKFDSFDRIVIYTDGIIEAENLSKKQFGVNGLRHAVVNSMHKSVTKFSKALLKNVRQYCNDNLRDDIMLVVAEIK